MPAKKENQSPETPAFKLERDGDTPGPDQIESVEPVVEKTQEAETVDVALVVAENEQLKQYIKDELANMKAAIAGMGVGAAVSEEEKKVAPDILDQNRPFAKTRTSGGGVYYTQDGKEYDGKFRLKVK